MGVALCPQIQCSVRIPELANYVHVCKYVHEHYARAVLIRELLTESVIYNLQIYNLQRAEECH